MVAVSRGQRCPRVVESLSFVGGVVVAVGYCNPQETPQIVFEGVPLAGQQCSRYDRADSVRTNSDGAELPGFRLAAITDPDEITNNSRLGVRFPDGQILRRTLPNTSDAHRILDAFAGEVAAHPGSSMIEIGSRARSGNIYKTRFPSLKKYVGLDVTAGPNVDIVADAHTMSSVINDKFDYGFSVSVFEHLMMPWVAAYELGKVMRIGGLICIVSHPTYPLHEEPWDFFRFSCNAWKGLFNRFTGFQVIETGYSHEASIVPLNAESGALQSIDRSTTFLVSACLARKVAEAEVDWSCDPALIASLQYSHGIA